MNEKKPRKPKSYTVNAKSKTITVYTNVKKDDTDDKKIRMYVEYGYTLKITEKKTKSVVQMRKDLKKYDEKHGTNELGEFDKLYKEKKTDDQYAGFHNACRHYNKVMKKAKEEAEE